MVTSAAWWTEDVEAAVAEEAEEGVVAERGAEGRRAALEEPTGPLAADLVGVALGLAPEHGRDLVAGGRQLADQPESGERAGAREEYFHGGMI
ncbi:hypothetical protein [Planctomyces sp. SH-PL62]|uniref:hypothetical protein n=1 Tax=Planctomyces sp. SH-PL62 TaxID=1636152 RepID=UPI00083824E7|nr:hypothetical protein [Planctomyces sp. SH-PL62]